MSHLRNRTERQPIEMSCSPANPATKEESP